MLQCLILSYINLNVQSSIHYFYYNDPSFHSVHVHYNIKKIRRIFNFLYWILIDLFQIYNFATIFFRSLPLCLISRGGQFSEIILGLSESLELNGQAMTIPAWHIVNLVASHQLVAIDHIFENLWKHIVLTLLEKHYPPVEFAVVSCTCVNWFFFPFLLSNRLHHHILWV